MGLFWRTPLGILAFVGISAARIAESVARIDAFLSARSA
jgi:hypothetical protein